MLKSILLIEDDPTVRRSLGSFLEDLDFSVVAAETGQGGLDLLREKPFDAIIVDLNLPDMSGLEIIEHAVREHPELPVLVASGTDNIRDAVDALRKGAWDFITKPIEDLEVLGHALNKCMERSQLIRENKAYRDNLEKLVQQRTTELQNEIERRTETQEALRASDERLRLLVDYMPVLIHAHDETGNYLFWNKECERVTGYKAEDVINNPDIIHQFYPDTQQLDFIETEMHVPSKDYRDVEVDITCADGTQRTIVWSKISDQCPIPGWPLWETGIDVTERRHTERINSALYLISNTLGESRDLNELFTSIHDILKRFIKAENFFIALLDEHNDRVVFPYFMDEKDGNHFEIQNFSDPATKSLTVHVLRTGRPLLITYDELQEKMETGEMGAVGTRSQVWLGVPLKLNKKIIGVMTVQDYSSPKTFSRKDIAFLTAVSEQVAYALQRRQSLDDLKASEEGLRLIMDSIHAGILIIDRTTDTILDVNLHGADMIGLNKEAIIGEPHSRHIIPSREIGSGEPGDQTEYGLATSSGAEIPILLTAVPLTMFGKQVLLESFVEISDLKETEYNLQRAKEAAEAADRAKTQFLANISHELRTPLNGIMGLARLLQRSLEDKRHQEFLSMILQSSQDLLSTVNDLLRLAEISSEELSLDVEYFSLHETLQPLFDAAADEASEKGLKFQTIISEDVPEFITSDPAKLRQVMINLLDNAIRFTEEGSISVTVQPAQTRDRLPGTMDLYFEVRDTGIGIPRDKQEAVFESFVLGEDYLTKKYGGTGLGLAIAGRLAKLLGGTITLESDKHTGSTFSFTINAGLSADTFRPPTTEAETTPAAKAHSLSVLAAEDEPVNQALLRHILEKEGHRVTVLDNGREVLQRLTEQEFDLILMDVQMPDLNGIETTRSIRSGEVPGVNSGIPIIGLSAFAADSDRKKGLDAGMNDYLSKPFEIDELLQVLQKTTHPSA